MSEPSTSSPSPRRRSWLMALPLVAFAALAALFWFRLGEQRSVENPLRPDRPPGAANRAAAAGGPHQ